MHYGHPDVFDRVFHITRGGISKASRGINISEDIYAGIFDLHTLFSKHSSWKMGTFTDLKEFWVKINIFSEVDI